MLPLGPTRPKAKSSLNLQRCSALLPYLLATGTSQTFKPMSFMVAPTCVSSNTSPFGFYLCGWEHTSLLFALRITGKPPRETSFPCWWTVNSTKLSLSTFSSPNSRSGLFAAEVLQKATQWLLHFQWFRTRSNEKTNTTTEKPMTP